MAQKKMQYPKFVIIEMADPGPIITTFTTAHEVAAHLWGRYLPYLAVFKDRRLIHIESSEVGEIEKQLDNA